MATGGGGGGCTDSAGRVTDDRHISIVDFVGRSAVPHSPTGPHGTIGAIRSAVVDGDERGEDGSIFNDSVNDIESRVTANLAQVWKANPGQSHHFTSGLDGGELVFSSLFNYFSCDSGTVILQLLFNLEVLLIENLC